ncbi:hypothetical protein Naga_100001g202 [Nannochloropsis gaditana]|uniref:Uncharacterized protein n=1 Tax=Nannochloropsis gaditana TaxID=72520 RepID=W7U246_9STRA|nr:hypothetical protein Naga_100001g202 [Nannochloropsis gaditana]
MPVEGVHRVPNALLELSLIHLRGMFANVLNGAARAAGLSRRQLLFVTSARRSLGTEVRQQYSNNNNNNIYVRTSVVAQ